MVGTQLGKYRIDRKLGAGGMATVYAATHTMLGSRVAIKVLHEHLADQVRFRDRFVREAQAAAALRHPGVTQVFDVDTQDGLCYIAMEFLEGESLEDRLATGKTGGSGVPVDEAIALVSAVGQALSYAHRHGIVHRDVKPANVMITTEGRVVLADFGLAAVMDETRITMAGTTSGTPSYMSPEQIRGEQGDARSDIYSLGVLLYQLLAGTLPFTSETLAGMLQGHLEKPPPPVSATVAGLPSGVQRAVELALRKQPEERFQSVDEMLACLRAEPTGGENDAETVASIPASRVVAPGAAMPPPRTGSTLKVAAMATVVAVATAAWWWGGTTSDPGGTPSMASEQAPSVATDGTASMASAGTSSMASRPGWRDGFDTNAHGWEETTGEVRREVSAGGYEVEILVPNRAVAAQALAGGSFQDVEWSATAELVAGPPETGYGLVFRYVDRSNYGVFGINGLGEWSVWILEGGAWRELRGTRDPWTPHPAVRIGSANTLTVRATGSAVDLLVNGELVGEGIESPRAEGTVGFYAATSQRRESARALLRFDEAAVDPTPGEP